ncbi:MAG: prepilin-type N-terminal cleavage/methylation domain-containing protein [Fibrobacter sp.]|jgi:prepilin-type N-terminal cleavage/methylation domain-containing protein|uniref:pilus assembly FimT family protein n=1 Tax=Fibrobacter sp. UWP2 TaxID=1896216 RepID=UPI00091DFA89|nr:prepilin-type N-terminal cleavage/methylation domain-containing protein [Fibrobacter sp. UWP2]MBO7383343.1 prepilin-type N-terminal cleavage/methylation domain-containing protein [Fibrobacter sp.]MCR5377470.1 prepilin-type N-terminal cleavage/methylation domain-containing protein [Fibrobacter sp.]SHI99650.1 prepilin-type N-terminal cleavage/methylation domain-containing protein [Fibrobacter sp. UWP2]
MPVNSRRNGFTLVELAVAIACAAILTTVAWNFFSLYYRGSLQMAADYQRESGELLMQLRESTKNARGLGGRPEIRF